MGTKVINAQLGYGDTTRAPNPEWQAWADRKTVLEKMVASTPPALRQQVQDQLDAHLAAEPEQMVETEIGATNRFMNEMGDSAATEIRQGADDMRTVGHDTYTSGLDASAAAGQQATAAQGRQAPNLNVAPGGRNDQQAAGGAAAAFTAQDGSQRVYDAANHYGQNLANTANSSAQNVANTANNYAQNVAGFRANDTGAGGIRNAAQTGVSALNKFAQGPAGPSAAEAMLRLQAARDKAAAISRARSARGGPGAVAEAMKVAQAEAAGVSADTRGQAALTRATEAAANRAQSLQALTSAAGLRVQGQQAATEAELQGSGQNLQAASTAGQLALQGAQGAGQLAVQGAQGAGELAVQGATAGGNLALGASGQNLQAIQIRGDIANNIRAMDIDEAKAQLGAELQTIGLNDEQTRFFAGLSEQARQDANNARANATLNGANADAAAAQIQLQYATQAWQMLTNEQQVALQKAGIEAGVIQANNQNKAQERQQTLGFIGGLFAAGGAALASDRRVKHDVRRLRSMASALRSTPGSSYRYKDAKKHGEGVHHGPMAQDLEKTPEFRGAVKTVGKVKMVDTGRLALAHHAALSDLQRQIDRLEKLGRGKAKEERA